MTDIRPTPARPLEPGEADELIAQAHELRRAIIARVATLRFTWVELAAYLHAFHQEKAWKLLGYGELEEFLAEPEVEIKRTQFFRLVRLHEQVVIKGQVPPGELEGIEYTKLDSVLPAVRSGKVSQEEALADCRELTRSDLEEKYTNGREPNAPLAAEEEPEWCVCEKCGKTHKSAA